MSGRESSFWSYSTRPNLWVAHPVAATGDYANTPMIPLPEFKKLLGPAASGLSDDEVMAIRDLEERLADFVFDLWLMERNKP
jgi:hypothetical protein